MHKQKAQAASTLHKAQQKAQVFGSLLGRGRRYLQVSYTCHTYLPTPTARSAAEGLPTYLGAGIDSTHHP